MMFFDSHWFSSWKFYIFSASLFIIFLANNTIYSNFYFYVITCNKKNFFYTKCLFLFLHLKEIEMWCHFFFAFNFFHSLVCKKKALIYRVGQKYENALQKCTLKLLRILTKVVLLVLLIFFYYFNIIYIMYRVSNVNAMVGGGLKFSSFCPTPVTLCYALKLTYSIYKLHLFHTMFFVNLNYFTFWKIYKYFTITSGELFIIWKKKWLSDLFH